MNGNHIMNAGDNVSFTIDEEKFVVILESAGEGKSTLPDLLGALLNLTALENVGIKGIVEEILKALW